MGLEDTQGALLQAGEGGSWGLDRPRLCWVWVGAAWAVGWVRSRAACGYSQAVLQGPWGWTGLCRASPALCEWR